ncbi:MAG: site-2 protease family protein [Hominilimicola sp.]
MIKITKYIYINILTVIMFTICIMFHYPVIFYITYAVMILHESAHCIAAACIGLKISHITFHPFGVNLKLKNKMVYSLADEIILYISGPLCNAVLALAAVVVCRKYNLELLRMFYISNIMLFIMNMLPAVPLDGGIILRKILMYRYGYKQAEKVMRVISIIISGLIMLLGIAVLYKTRFNFSVLLFSALLIGNIFTQKEKYNVDFVKELMFHSKKKKDKVRHIIVSEDCDYRSMAEMFNIGSYNVVYITDNDGKIRDTLTETQIINHIMDM